MVPVTSPQTMRRQVNGLIFQFAGKSIDQKDFQETDRKPSSSKAEPKTPTKEQKDVIKHEHQRLKNEQKAQQKLEKEQQKDKQKLEKEQQKLEKEQQKLEKEMLREQQKQDRKIKGGLAIEKGKDSPILKTQKSLDVSTIKHQRSFEAPRPARNSVDLQYSQDLASAIDITENFSSSTSLAKSKK